MKKNNAASLINKKNPIHWLATGFGLGLAPYAPGTCGTLLAIPLYFLLYKTLEFYYFFVIILFISGIFICAKTGKDFKKTDHGAIVIDEVLGFLVTLLFVPFSWFNLILGFLLFRFFDITKPFPIRQIDAKLKGGFGVMLDDLLAGIFAGLWLYLINGFLF